MIRVKHQVKPHKENLSLFLILVGLLILIYLTVGIEALNKLLFMPQPHLR